MTVVLFTFYLVYFNTSGDKMQVFFLNSANSSVCLQKNRLTSQMLSESVETSFSVLFRIYRCAEESIVRIVLIVIISLARTLLRVRTSDLDKAENLGISQLDTLKKLLNISVGR